jgi:hypothetical protein
MQVIFELPEAPHVTPVRLSHLEFMGRFTDAELIGIYTAAKSSVPVEIWLDKFKLASDVDRTDARTIAGLAGMESAGLLSAGRAAEILA